MLSRELGVEAQLIKGDAGVFDVVANGNLIFSKHETGRFPEEREIVEALRSLISSGRPMGLRLTMRCS
jgi:selenoprotein W-related protein